MLGLSSSQSAVWRLFSGHAAQSYTDVKKAEAEQSCLKAVTYALLKAYLDIGRLWLSG